MSSDSKTTVHSIKGMNADYTCRGFKFEEGKTYTLEGKVKACKWGWHACTTEAHPLEVFQYYAPAGSRFHEVVQSGDVHTDDGIKISASVITIGVEIPLAALIKRAVDWVFAKATPDNSEHVTAERALASSTGDYGAAMSSGYGGKVMGADGNALFAVERDNDYEILSVAAGIVGSDGIKAGVWYRAKAGKLVEA